MARGVSSPAGDDKGSSPLTSAAFLKNCCTKKLLILLLSKIYFRALTILTRNQEINFSFISMIKSK
jgi:hypothetical protein